MAPPLQIKIIEQCQIFPSPNSLPQISLPLTIFDLPWLPFSPTQSIFFFQTTTTTSLPLLKHSLSLTLHHFYPLASRLSTTSATPHLTYSPGDSIPFTAAESTADFTHLSGYHPRSAADFHSLIPHISSSPTFPLFLVQVTLFPQVGFSIGVSFSHLLGDQRTFNHLMKTWAFICNSLKNSHPFHSFNPCIVYDRNVIKNPIDLHTLLLQQSRNWLTCHKISHSENMVRATFVVTLQDMENIKRWIIDQCKNKNQSQPLVLSPYVLTCSFIWVCFIKSELKESVSKNPIFFGFNAGALTRLDYHVPKGYFGNCVGFGRSAVAECELAGEDGLVAAAEAIGRTIKELDGDILGGAEKWVNKWEVFIGSGRNLIVVGSPKVDLYKMEFGWGRPIKVEEISIDGFSKGICLSESRDCVGGIEVGLVLPRDKMDDFSIVFKSGLKIFS